MSVQLPFLRTISRYTIVGLVCVALNNVILIGGEAMGIHYAIATVICFFFVGGLAYATHADYTFEAGRSWLGYGRFLGTQTLGLVLTLAILFVLSDGLGLSIWIAAPTVTIIMFIYQFLATRWAVGARQGQ